MRLYPILVLLTLFVAGCSSSPPTPNPSVNEREIVGSILQELCAAVLNLRRTDPTHFPANEGWMGAIETSLKTDMEASASPSATLLGPIVPGVLVAKGATAGSYNLAAGGSIDQTATALRDDKHYILLELLLSDSNSCPNSSAYSAGAEYQSDGKYLAGNLGIRDWLENGLKAQNFTAFLRPTTGVVIGPAADQGKKLGDNNAAPPPAPTPTSSCSTCPKGPPKPYKRQTWPQGKPFKYTLDPAFVDPGKPPLPLTYSETLKDGQLLPQWLMFDPLTLTFSGTVPTGQQGLTIVITATNSKGRSGSQILPVATPCPRCPFVDAGIPDLGWHPADPINYAFPIDAFTDPNKLRLKYDATLENADPLPSWLSFDPATRRFIGVAPATTQVRRIKVTATNTETLSAETIVTLSVTASATQSQPSKEPALTSGPTYTGTFTFLTKGSGQIGPSFSMDRAKGGAANLFSLSRTETNYVNVVLTAAGVPLQLAKSENGKTIAGVVAPGNADAVNTAIQRLDMSLQQLNLSHIIQP